MVEDQCSSFNHIEKLKERPTHLLVFLHHVILQFDPAPLVSIIRSVELYQNMGNYGKVLYLYVLLSHSLQSNSRFNLIKGSFSKNLQTLYEAKMYTLYQGSGSHVKPKGPLGYFGISQRSRERGRG